MSAQDTANQEGGALPNQPNDTNPGEPARNTVPDENGNVPADHGAPEEGTPHQPTGVEVEGTDEQPAEGDTTEGGEDTASGGEDTSTGSGAA